MKLIVTDRPHKIQQQPKAFTRRITKTRVSRGGIDEINPEDIIYGEYSNDDKYGEYIDLIYRDNDILRTFSGALIRPNATFDELVTLLRDDEKYYVIEIKEVKHGFAFKSTSIVDINVTSVLQGNSNHGPSCTWTIRFEDGSTRGVEVSFQSYFAYGKTARPSSMTNVYILEKALGR